MTCASRRTCTGGEEKISTIYFNFLSDNEIIICVWSTHRLVYIFSRIEMLQMHLLLIWTACLPDYYGRLMAFTNSQIKIYLFFVTNYGIMMFLASGTHLKFNSSFCTHFMKDAIPLHMVIFNLTPTEFPSVVLVLRVQRCIF